MKIMLGISLAVLLMSAPVSAQIPPAPEMHPLYPGISALIARAADHDAYQKLIADALPALERACIQAGDTACATWAANQRTWREEAQMLRETISACGYRLPSDLSAMTRQLYGPGYMAAGRTYEQQRRDQQLFERDAANEIAAGQRQAAVCAFRFVDRLRHLSAAISGRDLAAEEAQTRRAMIGAVRGSASALAALDTAMGPEVITKGISDLRGAVTAARRDHQIVSAVGPLLDCSEALAAAWAGELLTEGALAELSRERQLAAAAHRDKPREISKILLDAAGHNLALGVRNRDRARGLRVAEQVRATLVLAISSHSR